MMIGISRFMQLFPFDGVKDSVVDDYNSTCRLELERIRDFIILHYKVTGRSDTPFWSDRQNQGIPDTLAHRLQLFEESGHIRQAEADLFQVSSWLQVMLGQGIQPKAHHQLARTIPDDKLQGGLQDLQKNISRMVESMPTHKAFIEKFCSVRC